MESYVRPRLRCWPRGSAEDWKDVGIVLLVVLVADAFAFLVLFAGPRIEGWVNGFVGYVNSPDRAIAATGWAAALFLGIGLWRSARLLKSLREVSNSRRNKLVPLVMGLHRVVGMHRRYLKLLAEGAPRKYKDDAEAALRMTDVSTTAVYQAWDAKPEYNSVEFRKVVSRFE
ncbi:hypothetical protein ACFL5T_02780 [Gemmatimonadota bacterium]